MYDPMSHLIYATSREEVSHVWVNGILKYEEGHLISIDTQACKDIGLRWQHKLKQNI
jgi:5-methylthioadenosine/S-adenosylhomocysteine deaminase